MDYRKIGLKAGLEIHQQLNTGKLFCECPSLLRRDAPLFRVRRRLNPVAGEAGDVDIAALHEKQKGDDFVYEVYDTNCLVELDEEPPHEINREALRIAVQISLLLNCKIFPVSQVMRKTVIDGSNTSGFQRTVLIAHDGYLETSEGRVGIDYVFLEEDAARPSRGGEDSDDVKVYKIDRLGIPMVEIATGPHLHSPEQIKEAALKIGEILRACNVKRGIGTIRQDLNISINGSERVEIKGFQEPRIMIQTVDSEIKRQQECIENNSCESQVRKANPDSSTSFLRPMPGSARMYPETDVPLLRISREMVNDAKNNLPKLKQELQGYLKEYGLNDELIKLVLKENKIEDFKALIKVHDNPNLVAKSLVVFPRELALKAGKSIHQVSMVLNCDMIESILSEVDRKISEGDVRLVMQRILDGKDLEEALKKEDINLDEEIETLIKEKPSLSVNAYMGLIMAKFKGRVSGREIMEKIRERLK